MEEVRNTERVGEAWQEVKKGDRSITFPMARSRGFGKMREKKVQKFPTFPNKLVL